MTLKRRIFNRKRNARRGATEGLIKNKAGDRPRPNRENGPDLIILFFFKFFFKIR